ncbi:hypothetical protein AAMO2058_000628400 [Amorphochlora amoebiformis]
MGCKPSLKKMNCLVVGLDNSGKSTIIKTFKIEDKEEVTPTVGFSVENVKIRDLKNLKCTMFDMSGAGAYRNLWEHYYKECTGVIFVIDSADSKRLTIVREEIRQMLSHDHMAKNMVPVLFYANKMDVPQARSANDLMDILNLTQIQNRSWNIVETNALKGTGIIEGMSWLHENMKKVKGRTKST